mmetsp:Transcript_7613/g.17500  ORF Transcript_7613/g.17500 Transcript_7613/m.17500 type:complete len:433 (-) Transcript_7613:168-1466(-)
MSTPHVCLHHRHGNVEVELERKDGARQQHNKHRMHCVVVLGERDVHRSELHPPADRVAGRGRLEANGVPVGALEILKVITFSLVVNLREALLEHDQRVPQKQMRDVSRKPFVDASRLKCGQGLGVHAERNVVVGVLKQRGVTDVALDVVVPRPGDAVLLAIDPWLQRLKAAFRGSSAVDGGGNHIPPDINVCQPTLENGRVRGEGHHDGRHYSELVIQVASLVNVSGLHGDLQAAAAHSEGHAIHVNLFLHWLTRRAQRSGNSRWKIEGLVGRGIFEDGYLDAHLGLPTLPDVRCECRKARVRLDDLVRDVNGLRNVSIWRGRIRGRSEQTTTCPRKGGDHEEQLILVQELLTAITPEAQVPLDHDQIRGVRAVRLTWSCFYHPVGVLGFPIHSKFGSISGSTTFSLFQLRENLRRTARKCRNALIFLHPHH